MAARHANSPTLHLRNACDACTTAKVKCSQGRPQCKRCEYRGLLCQYSVSLRATKIARRPGNLTSSAPRGFSSSVTSSNHDGQEMLEDASINSPSMASANRICNHAYDQITPSFDDDSVLASFFENWDPDTTNNHPLTYPPESSGDPMRLIPNLLNLAQDGSSPEVAQPIKASQQASNVQKNNTTSNNNNNKRSRLNLIAKTTPSIPSSRASTAVSPPTPPPSTAGLTPTASAAKAISSPQACQCQYLILSKLSEISNRKADHRVPFDQCLSENKSAIALCNAAVNCSNTSHDDDLVLLLTSLALVTHVILFYDRPLGQQDETVESPSEENIHPAPLHHRSTSQQHRSYDHQEHQQPPPPPSPQQQLSRVRLSLGTYELDARDEQILQNNLLRIELSKIKSLMAAFESRFYTLEWMSSGLLKPDAVSMAGQHGGGGTGRFEDGEEKPLGELIGWLKRRLRVNYEALTHRGGVGM